MHSELDRQALRITEQNERINMLEAKLIRIHHATGSEDTRDEVEKVLGMAHRLKNLELMLDKVDLTKSSCDAPGKNAESLQTPPAVEIKDTDAVRRAVWLNQHGAPENWAIVTREECQEAQKQVDAQRLAIEILVQALDHSRLIGRQVITALELARNGLRWYRAEHPADVSPSDEDADMQMDAAVLAHRMLTDAHLALANNYRT